MYAFNPELGVCGLAAKLKLSLFAVVSTLSSSCGALMSRRAGDTCERREMGSISYGDHTDSDGNITWIKRSEMQFVINDSLERTGNRSERHSPMSRSLER